MYETIQARRRAARTVVVVTLSVLALGVAPFARADEANYGTPDLVYKLNGSNGRLELTTNTSRILTLDKNIPRVQVNNPDLLAVTPLSANQVQISAKKAGVTQVNLWDESGAIHTVDVLIYGDVRELEVALATQFPNSTIKVYRYSESLVLKGYVDQPEHVSQIVQLSSDYAPKIINNITVGGVQQVLLKVRVMEISRTKLRDLGVDWALLDGSNILAASNVSGLMRSSGSIISSGGDLTKVGGPALSGGQTLQFGVFNDGTAFFGILSALQQRQVAKTLAEPNIVAVSGRPAQFQVGGEFPILIPQSLGTTSIEYKPYGTQVDFLPIVLGNGKIRLEVRPRISAIDPTLAVVIDGTFVPALTVRQVDTAVEMTAGETFALAGLVQERSETRNTGLPYLCDIPILGVPFRRTHDEVNEIELLVLVTPEFVDGMSPCEAPCGGPGYATTTPNNCQLYCAGHVEVPAACNPTTGPLACGECGGPCGYDGNCSSCGTGGSCGCGPQGGGESIISDGVPIQGGTGYDDANGPTPAQMPQRNQQMMPMNGQAPANRSMPMNGPGRMNGTVEPDSMTLPPATEAMPLPPQSSRGNGPASNRSASRAGGTEYTVPRPYSPSRAPVFVRNASSPDNPTVVSDEAAVPSSSGGLIGPVGYDAE
jgi:pilus assembly protein CpaC